MGELALRVQRELAASEVGPAFEPVPVDRLNLPLVRVGGPAEAAGDALAAIEWAARQFCLTREALRLAVGPVFGAPGGVRLSVTPWDAVSDLRHGLRLATRESTALRPWLRELTPYRPHLTVAYATADVDAARVRPVLDRAPSAAADPPAGAAGVPRPDHAAGREARLAHARQRPDRVAVRALRVRPCEFRL